MTQWLNEQQVLADLRARLADAERLRDELLTEVATLREQLRLSQEGDAIVRDPTWTPAERACRDRRVG